MTEQEWQTSTDSSAMYQLMRESTTLIKTRWQGWVPVRRFRWSERRDRLFRAALVVRVDSTVDLGATPDWLFDLTYDIVRMEAPHGDLWQRARAFEAERARQAALLREFAGNPFRQPVLPSGWDQWADGLLVGMAGRIDTEGDFAAMPVLADALQDAGVVDDAILSHCREPLEHRCGCWVLDLLLGRQ